METIAKEIHSIRLTARVAGKPLSLAPAKDVKDKCVLAEQARRGGRDRYEPRKEGIEEGEVLRRNLV